MPRDIPTYHQCSPIEGVLISSKKLQRNMCAVRMEQQAQQHARRILREAQRQAELIRQHAYQDGYQQGMLNTMQHVAAFMADSQTIVRNCREHLSDQTRGMLSSAVDHPETLLLLLDEWLRNLPVSDETLNLTLPTTAKALQPQIMDLLAASWTGKIQLDYHVGPSFVMRYIDQVAEFAPEQYVEPATRSLLQTLDMLPQSCRHVSAQALQAFLGQWQVAETTSSIDGNPS